jgi:hypothetical protein
MTLTKEQVAFNASISRQAQELINNRATHFELHYELFDDSDGIAEMIREENLDIFSVKEILENKTMHQYTNWLAAKYNEIYLELDKNNPMGHNIARTEFRIRLFLLAVQAAGRQIYEPSVGLTDRLKKTDLRGLRTDDLRAPFPAFFVKVPLNFGGQIYNKQTGWHDIIGLYVVEDNSDDVRAWQVMFVGAPKLMAADDACFFFRIDLKSGETLQKSIDESQNRARENPDPEIKLMSDRWEDIFHWLTKFVLYVTSSDARLEYFSANKEARHLERRLIKAKGTKRKKISAKLAELDPMHRIIVGKGITKLESGSDGSGGSTRRTFVAGHFQHYWVGPRTSDERKREIRWKEPYWKGTLVDTAETIVRQVT